MNPSLLLLGLGLLVVGCSASDDGGAAGSGALTCEWLEGADNCWQSAVDEAYADCAITRPDGGDATATRGHFGDEYLSCSYPNGDHDVYGSRGRALDGGGNGHDGFYVEATRHGVACFTFELTDGGPGGPSSMSLTTKSGRVTVVQGPAGLSFQCADGRTYSASGIAFAGVLSCPTKTYPDGTTMVPVPLLLLPGEARLELFPPASFESGPLTDCTCAPPPPPADGGPPPPNPGCPSL